MKEKRKKIEEIYLDEQVIRTGDEILTLKTHKGEQQIKRNQISLEQVIQEEQNPEDGMINNFHTSKEESKERISESSGISQRFLKRLDSSKKELFIKDRSKAFISSVSFSDRKVLETIEVLKTPKCSDYVKSKIDANIEG
mmetsp:Transcript_6281/g.7027  ORF Transcript_6281/g.7027 Transcript_6281/m.7027 type:complete len:140 (-) Transcript_6281:68-487(-)